MKNCPNCNASLDDHVAFCVYCGAQLPRESTEAANPDATSQSVQAPTPESQPSQATNPPVGTPVFEQPPVTGQPNQPPVQQNFQQPPYQQPYRQPVQPPYQSPVSYPYIPMQPRSSNTGLMAWSIVLIVFSALSCSLPSLIMSIIALTSINGAKNEIYDFEYQKKLKTAKTLNIVSTVLLVLAFVFVIIYYIDLFMSISYLYY